MTQPPEAQPSAEIVVTPELHVLVSEVMDAVAQGKYTMAEAVAAALGEQAPKPVTPSEATFQVATITDAQRAALARLPEVYGRVVPEEIRALTGDELAAIADERETINTILTFLETRKADTIRETLANHMDQVLEGKGDQSQTKRDGRGHYAVKHAVPVPGTDLKVKRSVSNPKPTIDGATIQRLHEAGKLTREEYLALTKMPDVKRNFDEAKAREAFKKDPALLFKVAAAVRQPPPTTSITINP
jgi:hypothetical protein